MILQSGGAARRSFTFCSLLFLSNHHASYQTLKMHRMKWYNYTTQYGSMNNLSLWQSLWIITLESFSVCVCLIVGEWSRQTAYYCNNQVKIALNTLIFALHVNEHAHAYTRWIIIKCMGGKKWMSQLWPSFILWTHVKVYKLEAITETATMINEYGHNSSNSCGCWQNMRVPDINYPSQTATSILVYHRTAINIIRELNISQSLSLKVPRCFCETR